jgi:hypothetical protein
MKTPVKIGFGAKKHKLWGRRLSEGTRGFSSLVENEVHENSCSSSLVAAGRAGSWQLLPRKLSGLTVKMSFLSVKSVKSVVQLLSMRLAALGLLRLFVAIQSKLVTMNNLRQKPSLASQGQSRPVKVNQGELR